MSSPAPTVYLFYGDDELSRSEFIDRLKDKLGDRSIADLNTYHSKADQDDLDQVEQACASVPFLAPRRLIIVDDPSRFLTEDPPQRFYRILNALPPTTALVLSQTLDLGRSRGDTFEEIEPLLSWAEAHPEAVMTRKFAVPRGADFVRWVLDRAAAGGGEIERNAAQLLAEDVLGDPYLADSELMKLLDYVDRKRPIEIDDVERLTPLHGQSDIFATVDAIGERNGRDAIAGLRRLLQNDDPRYAFHMIIRQFRLMVLARQALDLGIDPQAALRVPPFVASKVTAQARKFGMPLLQRVYHRLLEIDIGTKTGEADLEVALEDLVATVSQ
ncbi:MAG TPA: DNA polymerase III subunit delta [Anaerolineales bacterium]|nr:DNA polymerase III subunit delta [Anaerolineales bacterium]